jgi:integrative and conjugative element protein (TIGR02256 family)
MAYGFFGSASAMRSVPRVATVWIPYSVRHEMLAEATQQLPNETGGVLVGYWSTEGDAAVITRAVGPGPSASHTRTSFLPDTESHIRAIADSFHGSSGVETYLGDWHTHPGGRAYLSSVDRETLRQIARAPEAQVQFPLMCVIGMNGADIVVAVWQYQGRRRWRELVARLKVKHYEP